MVYNGRGIAPDMRKEIVLAVIVGLIFGLGLTFAIYSIRQQMLRNSTPGEIEQSRQAGEFASPTPNQNLMIQEPEADLLTDEKEIQIVGRTLPDSYIVIMNSEREWITTADQDGDFAQTISLVSGGNLITIVATTSEGKQETVTRSIVYSTLDPDSAASVSALAATPTPAPSASPRATTRPTTKPTPKPTTTP